jgi:AcrR family transcriptional regulator
MSVGPTRAERRAATAARILAAAQEEFGARGVDGATVRGIARRAGVDPSLVLQHYGSKQGLFELAVRPAPDLVASEVPAHLAEVLDLRLRDLPPATRALMRSVLTSPEAGAVVRSYLQERVDDLARASDHEDAELRAAVLVSSILGLTIARHFIGLSALDDLDGDRIAAVVEPWFAALVEGSTDQD